MRMKVLLAGSLVAALTSTSCFFQNDPLVPNQPPVILSYAPDITFFNLTVPDSCSFWLAASDPDGDEVRFRWLMGDSLLGSSEAVTFHAVNSGEYAIRAEVRDGTRCTTHDWFVTVARLNDDPPRIEWYYPEQAQIACAVGDTLAFHLSAWDDYPSSLRYIYRLDGTVLQTGPPDLFKRFMESGAFVLEGIAWDGAQGDTIAWNVEVTGYPDTLLPGAIIDLSGAPGDVDGSILLEWTAPGDDGYVGRAASYIVRTSIYPIVTEEDWREAEGKLGEPVPSVAGASEHMTIKNLVSASDVFVTMRAVDDFLNLSPRGNCVKVTVRGIDVAGRVVEAKTGAGLPGVIVSASTMSDTSGADGSYILSNVPSYTSWISARDELVGGQPGAYYDIVRPMPAVEQLVHLDFQMIGVFGLVSTVEPDLYYLGRFLLFYKGITKTAGDYGLPTVYRGWNHWPIAVYSPAFVWEGLDLKAAASGAMDDWESSAEADVFTEVASPEEADLVIMYDTILDYQHNVSIQECNADGTPSLKVLRIYTQHDDVPILAYSQLVFAHELGHVIGFDHSRNAGHLMVGLTMPQSHVPTADEINAVRCLYRFPNIFDYSYVIEE